METRTPMRVLLEPSKRFSTIVIKRAVEDGSASANSNGATDGQIAAK
jgi:hypothetical protein